MNGLETTFQLGAWDPGAPGAGAARPPARPHRATVGPAVPALRRPTPTGRPPMLLLADWPAGPGTWDRFGQEVADDFDVTSVVLDELAAPGHGPGARSDRLAALLGPAAPQVVVAAGRAVPVALALARRHPRLVAALVLVHGAVAPVPAPPSPGGAGRARRLAAAALGPATALAALRGGRRITPAPGRRRLAAVARAGRPDLVWRAQLHAEAARRELPDLLGARWASTLPVLVTWGAGTDVPGGASPVGVLPFATYRPLPGAGHLAHEDAATVRAWLAPAPSRAHAATWRQRTAPVPPGPAFGGGHTFPAAG